MIKLSKRASPQKLFDYDCATLVYLFILYHYELNIEYPWLTLTVCGNFERYDLIFEFINTVGVLGNLYDETKDKTSSFGIRIFVVCLIGANMIHYY